MNPKEELHELLAVLKDGDSAAKKEAIKALEEMAESAKRIVYAIDLNRIEYDSDERGEIPFLTDEEFIELASEAYTLAEFQESFNNEEIGYDTFIRII
jgi:hypothetical protein